ncbi:hypothetical protein PM3016_2638 [Paenibacillus mucilaginosus 3016]|uniref:Uncharacterized protein n=1 Tax=Paenibacillus mucilaginosus 3016 TaxID=1116391 RepID=H6NFB1_9BACL|nr:hypothetical protein PM3016_2638 [Paenibacillus mucilaginosus 3016]
MSGRLGVACSTLEEELLLPRRHLPGMLRSCYDRCKRCGRHPSVRRVPAGQVGCSDTDFRVRRPAEGGLVARRWIFRLTEAAFDRMSEASGSEHGFPCSPACRGRIGRSKTDFPSYRGCVRPNVQGFRLRTRIFRVRRPAEGGLAARRRIIRLTEAAFGRMSEASGSEHGFSAFAGLPRADWSTVYGKSGLRGLSPAAVRLSLSPYPPVRSTHLSQRR